VCRLRRQGTHAACHSSDPPLTVYRQHACLPMATLLSRVLIPEGCAGQAIHYRDHLRVMLASPHGLLQLHVRCDIKHAPCAALRCLLPMVLLPASITRPIAARLPWELPLCVDHCPAPGYPVVLCLVSSAHTACSHSAATHRAGPASTCCLQHGITANCRVLHQQPTFALSPSKEPEGPVVWTDQSVSQMVFSYIPARCTPTRHAKNSAASAMQHAVHTAPAPYVTA
jgi:hypothetical protein